MQVETRVPMAAEFLVRAEWCSAAVVELSLRRVGLCRRQSDHDLSDLRNALAIIVATRCAIIVRLLRWQAQVC